MKVVYHPAHQDHAGEAILIEGQFRPPVEAPERAKLILDAVQRAGFHVEEPLDYGLEPLKAVHDEHFLDFLEHAYSRWQARYGDSNARPRVWATRGFVQRPTASIDGQLGFYAYDASTPITKYAWQAARASANSAIHAAHYLVKGEKAAFALCRPPGHHAMFDRYGGFCFLNNAAIAAQVLCDAGIRPAIVDVDYHHGNGTQHIFYDQSLLTCSIHADPDANYPFFLGFADETGTGEGAGYNLNLPLPDGTTWQVFAEALEQACNRIQQDKAEVLVVSLGVDTYAVDPLGTFALEPADFTALGQMLAELDIPTLFVMEGGYATHALGNNVVRVLQGFMAHG
jgi:acetoin utilization deacetylase AcuC-like enzyme